MEKKILLFLLLAVNLQAQQDTSLIRVGTKAPPFLLQLQENSLQSFAMPYMNRIVLLHFWSNSVPASSSKLQHLEKTAHNYRNTSFNMAEGFEVVCIAVQTDRKDWTDRIVRDSLNDMTHGIAIRGYKEEVCSRYGVKQLPATILIDEKGMVQSINPRIADIEAYLDYRRSTPPLKKDITGTLAQSSNKQEPIPYCKLYMFNSAGDSLQKTMTSDKGAFIFPDVKLNQDIVLKVDNKVDINTSDPIALYTSAGEFMMDGKTLSNGFVFSVPARYSNKFAAVDSSSMMNYLGQIDIIKHLTFYSNGEGLTPKDEQDLKFIIDVLRKNKDMKLELTTHTDARMDAGYARDLTGRQASAIQKYLEKKGVEHTRISTNSRGNSELRKICEGGVDCREEDHQMNRRVEFLLYRN